HYDYFKLIKNVTQKFNFIGGEQKIDKIIVRAAEYLINGFLKNALFSEKVVYDLKDKLNISLIFYNDVSENEITFVNSIFKNEGYTKIKSFYYNYLLLNFLDQNRKIGSFKGYIILDSIENNLHINYFDNLSRKQYRTNAVGKDLAIDPRIKLLGASIINIAIEKTGSLVNPKDEINKHDEVFKKAYSLYNKKAEFNIQITLSDGASSRVKIKKSRIEKKLTYANEFTKDFNFLDHFYEKTGVQQSEMIFILHKNIHSESFSDKIKSNYTNVYHCTELSSQIFQLFYKNEQCASNGNLTLSKPNKAESTVQKNETKKENKTVAKIVITNPIGNPVTKAAKKPLPPLPPPPKPFIRVKPVTKKATKTSPPPPPPPKPLSRVKPVTKQTIKIPPPVIKSIGKKKPVKNNVSKLPPPPTKLRVNSKSKGPPPLPKK
ncbi:MAG: hypothetical protein P8P27_10300, partial [Flavobacteriaceae bacterium]|nr:hypothetical protein [Flavobacteriaceae bacterium]